MSFLAKLSQMLTPQTYATAKVAPVALPTTQQASGNPFLNNSTDNKDIYGKNMPVPGGYFAGYYDGKPNIVGRKLFVVI